MKCEPIDLGHFVVDVGEKHMKFYSNTHPTATATANALLVINVVPSLQRGPWSCIRHTLFPNTCFLTFLVTLSAAWHTSNFVPAPYKLKQ